MRAAHPPACHAPLLPPADTFAFKDGSEARVRFTYVYQKQADGKWKISYHHSSLLPKPEGVITPPRQETVVNPAAFDKEVRASSPGGAKGQKVRATRPMVSGK
jgi:hypothetical protein